MSRTERLLLETARRGELHHAIILHGPDPARLRELAGRLAMALNCPDGPDGCASCTKIARGVHPDVHFVGVEENRKLVSVDQIRQMLADAALRPYEGRTKVFVVDGADTISPAGANAMLKTLEEPGRDTVFLLLTRSADLLLPTIRSRSHAVAIHPSHERSPRAEAEALGVPIQAERIRRAAASLNPLDPAEAERIAGELTAALALFAESRDLGALLGTAAMLTALPDPAATLPLLAMVLRDAASLDPADSIDPARLAIIRTHLPSDTLLRAAATAVRNATRLAVNADSRLLIEQALLQLAR